MFSVILGSHTVCSGGSSSMGYDVYIFINIPYRRYPYCMKVITVQYGIKSACL
jgi:hypothetical protein